MLQSRSIAKSIVQVGRGGRLVQQFTHPSSSCNSARKGKRTRKANGGMATLMTASAFMLDHHQDKDSVVELEEDKGERVNEDVSSSAQIKECLQRLRQSDIQLVAIDFDQTLIRIHTGGEWWRDEDQILPYIRPQFRSLIRALHQNGFRIAIVTFSRQVDVLNACLCEILGSKEAAAQVHIRAYPAFWTGKQEHLESVMNELRIKKSNVLLIDDSQWNILIAKQAGIAAIWFDPEEPDSLWNDLDDLD